MRKPESWPAAALPRLLDAKCAAFYVGLSTTTFLARVDAGAYPGPRQDGRRRLWDRAQLDRAIDGARAVAHSGLSAEFIDPDEERRALDAIRG